MTHIKNMDDLNLAQDLRFYADFGTSAQKPLAELILDVYERVLALEAKSEPSLTPSGPVEEAGSSS